MLRWEHSDRSRLALGHPATALRLESLLQTCHRSNRDVIGARLVVARQGTGPTLFDEVVAIIRDHGPGGTEEDDGVDLELR